MHKIIYLLILNGLILLIISCNRKQLDSVKEPVLVQTNEESAVKAVLTEMWDAIEKKDITRYALYVHPDFTQFGETDSVLQQGKTKELASINKWLESASNVHTEMINPIVNIRGEVAWVVYYWSDDGLVNGRPFASKGKSTRIFVKENGKWLCIHGHYTLLQ